MKPKGGSVAIALVACFLACGGEDSCGPCALDATYVLVLCDGETVRPGLSARCSDGNWGGVSPALGSDMVVIETPSGTVLERPLVEFFDETGSTRLEVVPVQSVGTVRYYGCAGELLQYDLSTRPEPRVLVVHWVDNLPAGFTSPYASLDDVEMFHGARALVTLLELGPRPDGGVGDAGARDGP